jgi:hypothetical protein
MGSSALFLSACLLAASLPGSAQEQPKHLQVATLDGPRPLSVSALAIERSERYGGMIRLKGAVEIRTPICVKGQKGELTCDGEMVLRADEAELNESTGEVHPRGNVSVIPVRLPKR